MSTLTDTITRRFSCRTFSGAPIPPDTLGKLESAAAGLVTGPFGSRLRFVIVAATDKDSGALKRLGTYGTIRGASAFILGAADAKGLYLEDFGWAMERLILDATALNLGTCWIGGFFTRGTFARRIGLERGERIPAVTAVGGIQDIETAQDGIMRRAAGGSRRKPWDALFDGGFGTPVARESAGPWVTPLEMARWAPSASNRQPVRIVRSGRSWHFFIRRTAGYPPRVARALMGVEDLPRVDCGIAMCHFELIAREQGLAGRWVVQDPAIPVPDELTEYSASWEGER